MAIATLAGCQGGDADTTQASSKEQSVTAGAPLTLTTSSKGLVPRTTAKGTKVRLDGHFDNAVIMRRNSDGTLSAECHDEAAAAQAFVQGAAPSRREVK
jgi:hypothetical protein